MNLDAINNPRGALEVGLANLINDSMATYQRLNSVVFSKDTPRFEITVKIGQQRQTSKYAFPAEGIIRYDTWDFTAKVDVFTRPSNAPAQDNLHSDLVSRVAGVFSSAHKVTWSDTTNFPLHYIAEAMRETGRPSSLKPEQALEQTTLTWLGIVGVRATAWTT